MKYRPHIESRWRDRWENESRMRHKEYLRAEAFREEVILMRKVCVFFIGVILVLMVKCACQ